MPVNSLINAPEVVGEEVEEFGADRVLWDESNPRSLINIVPDSLREAMLKLTPDLKYLSEVELHRKCLPDPVDGRLRLNFWDEYDLAQKGRRNFRIANVVRNVSSFDYWKDRVLTDPRKVAYICLPPKDYIIYTRALHDKGMERLEEILSLPLKDKRGHVNTKLVDSMIKIVQMLDLRVKGAIIQKHQITNKNLNLNVDAGEGKLLGRVSATPEGALTMEQLEEEIDQVRNKIKQIESPGSPELPKVIDAVDGEVV